jgi:hypothetical protein
MGRAIVRQVAVVLAIIGTIAFNGLANALPLNGQLTGAISDRFVVLFVPAGYVFSIWGVIYAGLIAFGIYQAAPARRDDPRMQAIAPWFLLSCGANVAWLALWHYNIFVATVPVMLVLLVCLVVIFLRLRQDRAAVGEAARWCVDRPFSVYLGWITVATVVNITSVARFLQWDGFGIAEELWASALFVAVVAIAGAMSLTRRDVGYAAVLIWALAGIAAKHPDKPIMVTGAWLAIAAVGAILAIALVVFRRQPPGRVAPA